MVIVVDLPFAEDANAQLQDLIDRELGPATLVVRRTQLVSASPVGYRFQAVVEERRPELAATAAG
jgi:hypothetical protein